MTQRPFKSSVDHDFQRQYFPRLYRPRVGVISSQNPNAND